MSPLPENNISHYCISDRGIIPIYDYFIKRNILKKDTVLEIISYYDYYRVTDGAWHEYIILAIDKNNILYDVYPLFKYITRNNLNSNILNYFTFN